MAYECYLTIKGSKQGAFRGGEPRRGDPKNWIGVVKIINDLVGRPDQEGTHDPTAIREGLPVTVVVEAGLASPQIFQALTTNEVLTNATLQFCRPEANGKETIYYTIELTNAIIASCRRFGGVRPREASTGVPLHEVSFKYQKLTVKYMHS
jgi:type VI secretion system Hcp family effector